MTTAIVWARKHRTVKTTPTFGAVANAAVFQALSMSTARSVQAIVRTAPLLAFLSVKTWFANAATRLAVAMVAAVACALLTTTIFVKP